MLVQLSALIKGLYKRIFAKNNRSYWFEIFLTRFVLLTTLESLYRSQVVYQIAQAQIVRTCDALLTVLLFGADKITTRMRAQLLLSKEFPTQWCKSGSIRLGILYMTLDTFFVATSYLSYRLTFGTVIVG